jgi:hypothetical protein
MLSYMRMLFLMLNLEIHRFVDPDPAGYEIIVPDRDLIFLTSFLLILLQNGPVNLV